MKRFLLVILCLLAIFVSTTISELESAHDAKPPITDPTSIDDFI